MRLKEIYRIEQDRQLGSWHIEFQLEGYPRSEVFDYAAVRCHVSKKVEALYLQGTIEIYDDVREQLRLALIAYLQKGTIGRREFLTEFNEGLQATS